MKYVFILLFSSITVFASEKDSVYCFNKEQITKLASKIQTIRDSNDYLVAVVNAQDTVIDVYQSRSETFLKQLNNRDQVIDACQKRSKELEKINEELQPRWYDNKFLWFFSGVGTVLGIMFTVK
jgi:hypothetical protein